MKSQARDPILRRLWAATRPSLGLGLGLGVLAFALLTTSCAGSATQQRPLVDTLEWRGADRVSPNELAQLIVTRATQRFPWQPEVVLDEITLAGDVERIETAYKRRGFYHAKVRYELGWNEATDRAAVTFVVDEGPPVRVASRQIRIDVPEALGELPTEPWVRDLPGAEGEIFSVGDYERAKELLLRRVREAGFLSAGLSGGASVDVETNEARVDWKLATGPRVVRGPIEISGLERFDRSLVQREIQGEPEMILSPSWISQTQRDLAQLSLFRSVVVRAMEEEARSVSPGVESWPIEIQIEERPPRTIGASVGYGTDEGLRGRIRWEHRNLLGGARSFRVAAGHSSLSDDLELGLRWPRLVDANTSGDLRLDLERQTLEAYDATLLRSVAELDRSLPRSWRAKLRHRLELSRTTDVSDATQALLEDSEDRRVISVFEFELGRLAAEPRQDPERGANLQFRTGLSPTWLGSDVDFVPTELQFRGYRSLAGAVLATRLELATLIPFASSSEDDIPLTERLFAGGGASVRGFKFQTLGPRDANGEPIGGATRLIASAELRVPVRGALGAVVFLDGGLVEKDAFAFNPTAMRYSTGLGLRVATPVGPLRIDLGYLLNPPDDFDRVRLHLSVGQAF